MANGVRGDGRSKIRKVFDAEEEVGGRGGGGPPEREGPPVVQYSPGNMPAALEQFEDAAVAAGPGPGFQRAGEIVHIADRPARRTDGAVELQAAIVPMQPPALATWAAKFAVFEKWDNRANDYRRIDPPTKLIEAYCAKSRWRLPDLRGILHAPTLRADGSILHRKGYDSRTGLYLVEDVDVSVPDAPTNAQAEAANETLVELLRDFPFVEDSAPGLNLAVALAGLVGAVLRPTLPAAPLIGISAPAPGSGKTYMVDLISIVATGRRAIGLATGSRPEEFEKALASALMEGRAVLCLDNMEAPLSGQLLCMAVTSPAVSVRVLGRSQMIDAPTGAALFATGNNLAVKGDMSRRVLLCRLDAGVEHPEDREFDQDLLGEARQRRGELLAAVLTLARWHHLASDPAPRDARRFAGFEAWCQRVRDPLLRLGHADAVAALDVTREADLEGARLAALVGEWDRMFASTPTTAPEAIASADDLLMSSLLAVAESGGKVSARRLSTYLLRFEGRIVQGLRFRRLGTRAKVVEWALERAGS